MTEQMSLFDNDPEFDWIEARSGWGKGWFVHRCTRVKGRDDPRWYVGDGPLQGQVGIHAAGCWYRRDDAIH
mgnify:CR=1 FL=1